MIKRYTKADLEKGLPFLYGQKYYAWQRAYFNSRNDMCLMTAANQIGKSTIQIRKMIHWATNKKLWPELWPKKPQPRLFWYLYPSKDVAHVEWITKIHPLMPKGDFKKHPVYGWTEEYDSKRLIDAIHFNSGVSVYFKTYGQKRTVLQTATVWAVFCDEELPEELYDELSARTWGVRGYFSMVFTATLGCATWYRAMEAAGEAELFKDAFKIQVEMADCLVFDDGSPGLVTEEDIERAIARCKNHDEYLRRVKGRFVISKDKKKYHGFDATKNFCQPKQIPKDWLIYSAVDPGSGGKAHSPAATFVAVRPDYQLGYVFRGKKWDDGRDYSNGDILNNYIALRGSLKPTIQRYDQAAKDFYTIASRRGETFLMAVKDHDEGTETLNTLFTNRMLYLFDDSTEKEPQMHKLAAELSSILTITPKRNAIDDFADALRYTCVSIPWDFTVNTTKDEEENDRDDTRSERLSDEELQAREIAARRGEMYDEYDRQTPEREFDQEIDEWNELYGT